MIFAGRPRRDRNPSVARGFTLVELAVVVLVVGLLIGSLLVPLSTQVDQRNATEAQRRLEDAREALIGYAIANQRFPCPASDTSNGQESFCTNAGPSSPATCGGATLTPPADQRCSNYSNGYLPGALLGLNNLDSSGYALDGYPLSQAGPSQGRIRYAVADPTFGATRHGLTTTGTMRAAGITTLGNNNLYLFICNISTGITATTYPLPTVNTTVAGGNVAFIVFSLGKNGTGSTSTDEVYNMNSGGGANASINKFFISRPFSSASAAEFDDQLVWVSNYTLISRLIAAGMLP
jgi:prepilin-type N-terminal cleavage/methylation domain-containing protein